ncbi:hypothetical protein D3C76_1072490 [compost metagenome]
MTDVNIAFLAAFRQHAMAVERIKTNPKIAFMPAGLVEVNYVCQWECGDFLATQAGLKPEPDHHSMMWIIRGQ